MTDRAIARFLTSSRAFVIQPALATFLEGRGIIHVIQDQLKVQDYSIISAHSMEQSFTHRRLSRNTLTTHIYFAARDST